MLKLLLALLSVKMFFNVMDEFTKGTATSGSQNDSVIFFKLKLPFKQELNTLMKIIPIAQSKIDLSLFILKSLTFCKCIKNIKTKKGDTLAISPFF